MIQVGVDISKTKFDACLLIDSKTTLKTFGNSYDGFNAFVEWLSEHELQLMHVCMEGTGKLWEPLAEFLHSSGCIVSVVNPFQVKGFAQSELRRSKTDKIDAKIIARFCRSHSPVAWIPPSPETRAVRDLQRYIDALKAQRTQENNRLQSGVMHSSVQFAIEQHLEYLHTLIDELENQVLSQINASQKLRRNFLLLTSINGVGQTTAATFLGELSGAENFSQSRQLEVFCGIAPRLYESGSSVRARSKISKIGNSRMRNALYMPAMAAMRTNPALQEFASRLKAAGKPGRVVICAVMRKLLRIMFAVVKSGIPYDSKFRSVRKVSNHVLERQLCFE